MGIDRKGAEMYYLTDKNTGEWIGTFAEVNVTENGVWVWCGLFATAIATKVHTGLNVTAYDGPGFDRVSGPVIKVNRKTFDLQDANGKVHRISVDR